MVEDNQKRDTTIYPTLPPLPPSAPLLNKNPNHFRLKELEEKRKDLFQDIERYEKVLRKSKSVYNGLHYTNTGFSLVGGVTGAGTLGTALSGIGIVVAIPLAGVAVASSVGSFVTSAFSKKVIHKIKKYEKLLLCARSSYSAVAERISDALIDENISHAEYKHIMEAFQNHEKAIQNIKSKHIAVNETNYKHDFEALKKQIKDLKNQR